MLVNFQSKIMLNFDKKYIVDPSDLTLSGDSEIYDIAYVDDDLGNPFLYYLFQLLRDEWQGDRLSFVNDTIEAREFLTKKQGYAYFQLTTEKYPRRVIGQDEIIGIRPTEFIKLRRNWKTLINQYVLINYDSHLFMTVDRRLLRHTFSFMPYILLAQGENQVVSEGSWSGDRVGIESIGTPTLRRGDYFEMFRMIGESTYISKGVEGMEEFMEIL